MTPLARSEHVLTEATRLLADIGRAEDAHSFVVTGCAGGEGATTMAIALARAVGKREGARALLVDADFADPALSRLASAEGRDGLRQIGKEARSFEASVVSAAGGLHILPAGRPGNVGMAELVASGAIEALVAAALGSYAFVFFDTHALGASADTGILLSSVPSVILVTLSDATRMDHFTSCLNEIANARAHPAAVLRNRAGRGMFSARA